MLFSVKKRKELQTFVLRSLRFLVGLRERFFGASTQIIFKLLSD